jgi:hypothetical protein
VERRVLASLGYTSTVEGLELQLQGLLAHKQQEAMLAYFGTVERRLLDISISLKDLHQDVAQGFRAVQETLKVTVAMGICVAALCDVDKPPSCARSLSGCMHAGRHH